MTKIKADQLSYRGESNGVHSWTHRVQLYYWQLDWLHIAEDATGSHPKQKIDVEQDQNQQRNTQCLQFKHLKPVQLTNWRLILILLKPVLLKLKSILKK